MTDTRHVLVVDDDPAIVELMRDFLEADGFQVQGAVSASAACSTLERVPVDCVLLDVMLPGETGFELIRWIRRTSEVPGLFLSARGEDADKLRIEVHWRPDGSLAQFTIADTGPGIAPHDLPHLFEPMYRADPSRCRGTGGAGLGLAIALRILRAHGGDLKAANRPTVGAIFTGSLPLRQGVPSGDQPAPHDRIRLGSA